MPKGNLLGPCANRPSQLNTERKKQPGFKKRNPRAVFSPLGTPLSFSEIAFSDFKNQNLELKKGVLSKNQEGKIPSKNIQKIFTNTS